MAISDVLSTPAAAVAAYTAAPATPAAPAVAAPTPSGFVLSTVELSESGQVHALQLQGLTPFEIAQNLGIALAVVDGYLNIPAPAATATPTQAATPPPSVPTR